MRLVIWLLRAFIFFTLFAFALNNQQAATVHWFFGVGWNAPMVIIVLAAFAAGCVIGVLAMVPGWWRHRRVALAAPAMVSRPASRPASAAANSPTAVTPPASPDAPPHVLL
jgi:lipopolysaccharide assembly protein A